MPRGMSRSTTVLALADMPILAWLIGTGWAARRPRILVTTLFDLDLIRMKQIGNCFLPRRNVVVADWRFDGFVIHVEARRGSPATLRDLDRFLFFETILPFGSFGN